MNKIVLSRARLAGLLLAVAFISPARAEEVTVTVPPDDTPAAPAAAPASPALPTFSPGDHLSQAGATDGAAPADGQGAAAQPSTPAPTKHKKEKKPSTAAKPASEPAAADGASEQAASPADAAQAKAPDKPKQAKVSSCKGLEEDACGGNKLCIWVAPGPDATGKAAAGKCRSLAALKKEESKKKAAKAGEPEVLPWATSSTGATTPASAGATDSAPVQKTAAVKKPAKHKETKVAAPPVVPQTSGDGSSGADAAAPSPPPADSPPDPQ